MHTRDDKDGDLYVLRPWLEDGSKDGQNNGSVQKHGADHGMKLEKRRTQTALNGYFDGGRCLGPSKLVSLRYFDGAA